MPTRDDLTRAGRRAVEDARGRMERAAEATRGEWRRREGQPGFERAGRALSSGALTMAGWKPAELAAEARGERGTRRAATEDAFPRVVDLDEVTREELYERAKELEVPGRSKMSKEQLAQALAQRGG